MSSSNLPQFNDTAQAFQHLTDAELRRAVALFSLIGKTWLVNAGSALAHLALALRVPLAWAVKPLAQWAQRMLEWLAVKGRCR